MGDDQEDESGQKGVGDYRKIGTVPCDPMYTWPTIDLDCLYDHVHLYRETVPILAKTLKDVALNRSPTSPPRNSRAISTPKKITGTIPRTSTLGLPATTTAPPQCLPQPAQHRPPQPSFRATQTRPPTPHLRPTLGGATAQQAQAVRGATGPAPTNQMSDIKHAESTMLTCDRPRVMAAPSRTCKIGPVRWRPSQTRGRCSLPGTRDAWKLSQNNNGQTIAVWLSRKIKRTSERIKPQINA
uniref:uncharacterized protein LOC124039932 n=1 Tax=Oncorhynchus gorbuscha TaxID=8017 RepID=UPI001EAF5AF5|nr:uncharacterized protein LOC124039932 [Oncorhynchus gorbuscha]